MNMFKRALTVLFAYVSTAFSCQVAQPVISDLTPVHNDVVVNVSVYISPEFSNREQMNIIRGIVMWEKAVNGSLTWQLQKFVPTLTIPAPRGEYEGVQYRTVLFRRAVSNDNWVIAWQNRPENNRSLLGICQFDSLYEVSVLWLVEDRLKTETDEIVIAAHEFGHALGIKHIDDKSSVMSTYYVRSTKTLTKNDIDAFFNVHECILEGPRSAHRQF